MRQIIALRSLTLSLILIGFLIPAAAKANHPAPSCTKTYSYKHLKSAARSVYRHGTVVTTDERQKLRQFRLCARSHEIAKRMIKKQRAWMRWRGSYRGYWRLHSEQLSAGTLAGLANLRGCETRGSTYPANYRYNGSSGYDGSYQYDGRTWWEANNWFGTPTKYRTSAAWVEIDGPIALKDHQDVVTAAFYPSHTSRWPNCSF